MIAVAMSGGVDSSAAAVVLRDAGEEIVGLSMQLWNQRRGLSVGEDGEPHFTVFHTWDRAPAVAFRELSEAHPVHRPGRFFLRDAPWGVAVPADDERREVVLRAIDEPDVASFLACWLYEETFHGLGARAVVEPVPNLVVKGSRDPVTAYVLHRLSPPARAG